MTFGDYEELLNGVYCGEISALALGQELEEIERKAAKKRQAEIEPTAIGVCFHHSLAEQGEL